MSEMIHDIWGLCLLSARVMVLGVILSKMHCGV